MIERSAPRIRATRQGAALDRVLTDAGGFATAHELYDELRRRGESVGLTTVYRQIKLLLDAGVLDVVTKPDGEASYRHCGPTSESAPAGHHHHIVCRECGYTVEVEEPRVEAWAEQAAVDAGFTDISHTVEIFGRCSRHSQPG